MRARLLRFLDIGTDPAHDADLVFRKRMGVATIVVVCLGFLMAGCTKSGTPSPGSVGRIAFTSDRDGNYEIYVMAVDGSSLSNLTNSPTWDSAPSWSPDGTRIAFHVMSDDGTSYMLYVMSADGSGRTSVGEGSFPAWSPDGTRIAFNGTLGGISVVNPDGSGRVRLSESGELPAWSPDGSQIGFGSIQDGVSEIIVMNADGSGAIALGEGEGPTWSPDGQRILFHSHRDGTHDLFAMDSDGSDVTRLTSPPGEHIDPSFSPDGTSLVYTSGRDGNYEIYLMSPDGSNQTRITDYPATDILPAWSPVW